MSTARAGGGTGAAEEVTVEPASPETRARLGALHQRMLAHEGPWGEWAGGETNERGAVQMPYAVLGPLAVEVYRALTETPELLPMFDWMRWEDGRRRLGEQDLARVDERTARMMLTTVLRQNRYWEGFLMQCFDNGTMTRLVGIIAAPPAVAPWWRRAVGALTGRS